METLKDDIFSQSTLGIISGLSYGLFSALGIVSVFMVPQDVHPLTHLLFRSLATISVYSIVFARFEKLSLHHLFPLGERIFLFLVATTSAFGTVSFFTALQFLSAADVAAILNSAPVFVTLGAYIFLREKFGFFQGIPFIHLL